MTGLSTATQTVWRAHEQVLGDECVLTKTDMEALAAALRAAASQFDRPKRSDAHTLWNEGFQYAQNVCRAKLLNIADELDGIKYGTYRCNLEDKPQ